jgi:hypothetical protein
VRDGDELVLFSENCQESGWLNIRAGFASAHDLVQTAISPSGRTIAVQREYRSGTDLKVYDGRNPWGMVGTEQVAVFEWELRTVDADTLIETYRSKDKWGFTSVSDKAFATLRSLAPEYPKAQQMYIRALGESAWHAILRPRKAFGAPVFVTDNLVVVAGGRGLTVIKTDGEILFDDQPTARGEVIRSIRADNDLRTRDGQRLAIIIDREKQMLLDTFTYTAHSRLLVYDLLHRTRMYNLDLGEPVYLKKENRWVISEVAISAGGSLLARMRDGVLDVFKLPVGDSINKANAEH